MRQSISALVSSLVSLVAPARPTERIVAQLSLATLQRMARYDGTLPYHDERVRALVWELKYYAQSSAAMLAGEYISEVLMAEASDVLGKPLLIPMPMHAARRKERGHNQTEVLCKVALAHLGTIFEYAPDVLERTRNTKQQQGLERHVRLINVKNAMQVKNPARVMGRACIVVDDVTTTGATFMEATRCLRRAGARTVRCVALAQS